MLSRFTENVVSFMRNIAAVVLLLSLVLNFCNVVGRYFFNKPIEWGEEVMLFLMVGIVFLGASYVSWKGRQIAMDLLVLLLPPRLKKATMLLALSAEVVVPLIVVWLGAPVVVQLWNFDQRTEASDIPLAIPQALIPIGLFLVAAVTAVRIVISITEPSGHAEAPSDDKLAALK